MVMKRRSRRSFGRGTRRRTSWFHDASDTISLAAGAQGVFAMFANLAVADRIGATVVRMLLRWDVRVATGIADAFVDMGITIVTNDALTALAMPDPGSQDREGWYFWDGRNYIINTLGLSYGTNEADIRSARKIGGQDRAMVWVIDNSTLSDTTVLVSVSFRALLMLP